MNVFIRRKIVLILSALMLTGVLSGTALAKGEVMKEKVSYNQAYNNVKIVGELYKPENFSPNKKYPAIVVVHPAVFI